MTFAESCRDADFSFILLALDTCHHRIFLNFHVFLVVTFGMSVLFCVFSGGVDVYVRSWNGWLGGYCK